MQAVPTADQPVDGDDLAAGVRGAARRIGLVRIGAGLSVVQIATYLAMFAVTNILLPAKIQSVVGESGKETWLGIITTAGAVVTIATGPLIGRLSDLTRHRLGRRVPWMLGGAVVGALALAVLGFATAPVVMLLAWGFVQLGFGAIILAASAVLPERVAEKRRGTISGVTGLATTLAVAFAGFVGAAFVARPGSGTLVLGALLVVGALGFVVLAPDTSSVAAKAGTAARASWRMLLAPFRDHNFRWMWIGRFLGTLAYQLILTRQLYFVQDRFDLEVAAAATTVATVTASAGMLQVVGLVVSGPLSDRFGRRPFVYVGALFVGIGMLLTTQVSTVPQYIAAWAVVSLAFGSFVGVDAALAADVLPAAGEVGKDLAIVGLAQTLPNAAAPALGTVLLAVGGGSYTGLLVVAALLAFGCVAATTRLRGIR